jgi:CRISPR-associated protein Cas2
MTMLYVVCYDISNDRRRRKLDKLLKGYGQRVQESVFECDLDTNKLVELEEKITRRIEPEDDSVRIYRICAACRTAIKVIGRGPEPSEPAGNFEVV